MVGKSDDPAVLSRGSMIEGSFINGFSLRRELCGGIFGSNVRSNLLPAPFLNVVPPKLSKTNIIQLSVCSCQGTVVAGCNTALEHTGTECPEPGPADTCYNVGPSNIVSINQC